MKTLMFSLTFAIAFVLYGTGLFVPETQGVENTVSGLITLNDTEMSKFVGGTVYMSGAKKLREVQRGQAPNCEQYTKFHCPTRGTTTVVAPLFDCESCAGRTWRTKYNEMKLPYNMSYFCINRSDGCKTRRHVNTVRRNCDNRIGKC